MILKERLFLTIFTATIIFAHQSLVFSAVKFGKSYRKETSKGKQKEALEIWQINNKLADYISVICSPENKDINESLSNLKYFLEQCGDQVTVVSNAVYLESIPNEVIKLLALYCIKLQKIELAHCDKVQARAINKLLSENKKSLNYLSLVHMKNLSADTIQLITTKCRYLKFLCLSGCPIVTNENLRNIGDNLSKLEVLYLNGARGWLPDVIKLLRKKRPGIKIFTGDFFSGCLIA